MSTDQLDIESPEKAEETEMKPASETPAAVDSSAVEDGEISASEVTSSEPVPEAAAVEVPEESAGIVGATGEAVAEEAAEASSADAEEPQEPKNPNFRWYVIHTYSGYEEKAKRSVLERVKNAKVEEKFGDIVVPTTTTETTTKTGKKRQVTKTKYPGYVLIEMELDDNTLTLVKNTPRITGFLGSQVAPTPLSEADVMRYTGADEAAEAEVQVVVSDVAFEKGEGVKVIDGPFSNFDGVVDEVKPDKARLRVLVSIFGRETPVELEYRQVEKL